MNKAIRKPLAAFFLWLVVVAQVGAGEACFDVPFHTGTILPTPQQAQYADEFVPLGRVGIVLGKGLGKEDPRLVFLLERLTRCGAAFEFVTLPARGFDSVIAIGEDAEGVPEKPESYVLTMTTKGETPVITLKARDRLGLLWGISSFNQLVTKRDGRPAVRRAHVLDWPDTPGKRAFTAMADDENLRLTWLSLQLLRPNIVIYRMNTALRGRTGPAWRNEKTLDEWKKRLPTITALLNPLGIEWYESFKPISTDPAVTIRSKSEEDFQIVLRVAEPLAATGGNLCLLYDDIRFPISPDDKRDFGTAREADIFFLNKLHAAVAAQHPNFKILFCPPFYWGPASNSSGVYGESRDEYLAALGQRLPKGIHIYWTGPRVKSGKETPDDLCWITGLIQRKPVFWQNAFGVMHGGEYYHYPTDPIPAWRNWYDDAFLDGLEFFTLNSRSPIVNMTLTDFLWNHRAYDPTQSVVEAGKKLVGPDVYPKLVEVCRALEDLDIYGWSPNAAAANNLADVRQKTAKLLALAQQPALTTPWVGIDGYISRRQRYMERLLKNPNLKHLTEIDGLVRMLAVKEAGADPKRDLILTPNGFRLSRPARYYKKDGDRRHVVWINGARSAVAAMQAAFRLREPPETDFELIIAGLDHELSAPCRIRILANGKLVFEGPNPFAKDKWTTHVFPLPGRLLKDNDNTLTITNLEDSDNIAGPPWFMLSYAIIRKTK